MKILFFGVTCLLLCPLTALAKLTCLDLKKIDDKMNFQAIKTNIGEPKSISNKKETQYKWVTEGVTLAITDFGDGYATTLFGYNDQNRDTCKLCIAKSLYLDNQGKLPLLELTKKIGSPNSSNINEAIVNHWEIDDYKLDVETNKEGVILAIISSGVCIDGNAPDVEKMPYEVPKLRKNPGIDE